MLDGVLPTDTFKTPPFDANGALSVQNGATYVRDSAKNMVELMVTKNENLPDKFHEEINLIIAFTVDMVTIQSLTESLVGTLFDVVKVADPTYCVRTITDTRKIIICKPATHKQPNTNPARGSAITLTQTITLNGTRPLTIASQAISKSFFDKLRDLIIKINALNPDHAAHGLIYGNDDSRVKQLAASSKTFLNQLLAQFEAAVAEQLEVLRGALESGSKISGLDNLFDYCAPAFLLPDTKACGAITRTHDERVRELIIGSLAESMFCLDKLSNPLRVINHWIDLAERNTDNNRARPNSIATVVVRGGPEDNMKVPMFLIAPVDMYNKKLAPFCQPRQLEVTMPVSVVGIDWETHTSQHCFAAPNGSMIIKTNNGTVEKFSDQNPPMLDPNAKVSTHTAPCLIYRGRVIPVICRDLEESEEMNSLLTQSWSMDEIMTNNVIPALLNAERNYAVDMFHPANGMVDTSSLTNLLSKWQGCGPTATVYSSGPRSKRDVIGGKNLARIMEECVLPLPGKAIADHVLVEASQNKSSIRQVINEVLTAQDEGCFLHPHGQLMKNSDNPQELSFLPCLTWQEMNYVNHVVLISNVMTLMKRSVLPHEDRPGIMERKRLMVWMKNQKRGGGGSEKEQAEEDEDSAQAYISMFSREGSGGNRKRRRLDNDAQGAMMMADVQLTFMEFRALHRAALIFAEAQRKYGTGEFEKKPTNGMRRLLELIGADGGEKGASEVYEEIHDELDQLNMEYDLVHEVCTSFSTNSKALSKLVLNQARLGVESADKSKAYDETNYQILLALLEEDASANEDRSRNALGSYWLAYFFIVSPYTKGLFGWLAKHDLFLGFGAYLVRGESGLCENAVLARVGGMRGLFGITNVKDYNEGKETATLGPDGGDTELTMEASLEVGFADNSYQIPGVSFIAAHKISDDYSKSGTDIFVPVLCAVNAGWNKVNNRSFVAVLCPPFADMNHMTDLFNPLGRNMNDTNCYMWGDLTPASSKANIENDYPAVFGYRAHNPYGLRGGIALLTHLGAVRDGGSYKDPDPSVRRDGADSIGARQKQVEIPLTNYVRSVDPPTVHQNARLRAAQDRAEQVYSPFADSMLTKVVECQMNLGNPTHRKTMASRVEGLFKLEDRVDLSQISTAFGCGTLGEYATSISDLETNQAKMMSAKLQTAQAYGAKEEMSTLEHMQRQRFYIDVGRGFQIYCTGSAITRPYDQRVYTGNDYRTR